MRHVLLVDHKIQDAEFEQWRIEDAGFWKQYIGVSPTYIIERTDFTDYPTYIDEDGDTRPTRAYLKALSDQMVSKYGEWGFDFLMLMVHHDNWKSDQPGHKIWGTAWAYLFGNQTVQYCRWDKRIANTFGVAYHERHHVLDAICKVEVGVDVRPILGVNNYDHEITHGHSPNWEYIRYRENTNSLTAIAPHLRNAFSKRAERHRLFLQKKKMVPLLERLVYLYRALLNRKNGIPKW